MNDKTLLMKVEAHDVEWVAPPHICAEEATDVKGYPHPGSNILFPNGGVLPVQYDISPLKARNGYLTSEILRALIDHYQVYQQPGHPLACRETALMLTKLEEALHWSEARQIDRQVREVRFTDQA